MSATSLNLFDLAPGKVILDRYHILRAHRHGGMSATFEVEDKEVNERRELQVFPGSLFENRIQASDFAERLAPWQELSSSSILRLCEVQVFDDGSVLHISDFPKGASLREWMNEHERMDAKSTVRLSRAILEALVEIHSAGLVHGDIKPASIYYAPDDDASILLDGGITPGLWGAKHLGTRTQLIGTPYYAPLEQFTGDSPDELSDLYNIATVMYELLTGVLPWTGKGFVEVFQSKMQASPPKMAIRSPGVEVDPELEAMVSQGLAGARKDRHVSAKAFLESLATVALS
jgi:serine/threonine protein kinase